MTIDWVYILYKYIIAFIAAVISICIVVAVKILINKWESRGRGSPISITPEKPTEKPTVEPPPPPPRGMVNK